MGQFKPMVKMMTTEPSVILKLKKGGKVASKMDGGYMPMQSTMPAQAMPATPARGGLASAASPMKPSMAARRKAMMAKPAMSPPLMKKGGKADMGQDKAMIKKAFKQHDMQEHKVGSTKLKLKHGGKFATGGVVNGQGGFKDGGIIKSTKGETKMVTSKVDHSPAKTGDVKLGNGGGYKTGGVAKANGGGYKMGGSTKKAYATGGTVDTGKPVAMPKKPMSRPIANSMQSGTFAKGGKVDFYSDLAKKLQKNPEKPNLRLIKTHTGPKGHVAKVYKDRDYGEYRTKFYSPEGKHLTEGDSHTDDSEDAHMTAKHEVNRGYAKGGKTKKYADGSSVRPVDDAKTVSDKASRELEDALNPLSMIKEGAQKVRDYFTSKPAGSVTKTEKSVTVAPRKRGGSAMC